MQRDPFTTATPPMDQVLKRCASLFDRVQTRPQTLLLLTPHFLRLQAECKAMRADSPPESWSLQELYGMQIEHFATMELLYDRAA